MPSRLQTEIKQSRPFPSRGSEALASILRTAALLEHRLGATLRPFGVTASQYNVLRILRGAEPAGLCGREVGERMLARVPDVPRLLERMEALHLITRVRDASDRRHVTARITAKGLDALERIRPALEAMEHSLVDRLSDRTVTTLIEGLAGIRGGN